MSVLHKRRYRFAAEQRRDYPKLKGFTLPQSERRRQQIDKQRRENRRRRKR